MAPIAGAGAGAGSVTSTSAVVTSGTAGILVTLALIVCLSYLELFEASSYQNRKLHALLLSSLVPLSVAFGSVVLYEVWVA